jgi:fructose-bisphosphate aldolase class II/tagatose 1,6-diphosphate aldolase GatY/KbaY
MKLKEEMNRIRRDNSAILAVNFYNLETLRGILAGASEAGRPVILQLSPGSISYLGLETAAAMAKGAVRDFGIPAWLHLDHASSYDLIMKCLDAGFDSVMIDASEKPFEENVKITRKVVELAEKYGAFTEAELGYVAKLGQNQNEAVFTDPREAKKFVEQTGVDALAVAIGTAHGFYKHTPKLNLELLREIRESIPETFLVLHGSSGIPEHSIGEAVKAGIRKVNLATEVKNIFMKELSGLLSENSEIDLRKVFPPAIDTVAELVADKISVLGGGGK